MSKHLSVDCLLKSVLTMFALAVVLLTAVSLHSSWAAWRQSRHAERVVDASKAIFTALVNMRTDRSTTMLAWEAGQGLSDQNRASLSRLRDTEMPALATGLAIARDLPFERHDELLEAMRRGIARLQDMQAEFWQGIAAPGTERRPGLGQAYFAESLAWMPRSAMSPATSSQASRTSTRS